MDLCQCKHITSASSVAKVNSLRKAVAPKEKTALLLMAFTSLLRSGVNTRNGLFRKVKLAASHFMVKLDDQSGTIHEIVGCFLLFLVTLRAVPSLSNMYLRTWHRWTVTISSGTFIIDFAKGF